MQYIVTAPDGTRLRVTAPEGASMEEAIEYAKTQWKPTQGDVTPAKPLIVPEQKMSFLEKVAASIPTRALENIPKLPGIAGFVGELIKPSKEKQARAITQGLADPSAGLIQLGSRILGPVVSGAVDEAIKAQEKAYQKQRGDEGIDPLRIAGNIGSIINVAPGLSAAAKLPATLGGRAGLAAAMGATGGAVNPEYGKNFAVEKLKSIGLGAALGPAAELTGAGVSKVGSALLKPAALAVDSVLPGGAERAAKRIIKEAAGDKADEASKAIIQAIEANKKSPLKGYTLTASEAAESAGSTGLSGLEKEVKSRFPAIADRALEIDRGNRQAMVEAIERFAKTKADVDAAKAARGEAYRLATDPIWANKVNTSSDADVIAGAIDKAVGSKQSALQEAGKFATSEAENLTRAANFTPVPGMPRVSGRVSNFPDRAAEAASATKDAAQVYKDRSFAEDFLRRFEGLYDPSGAGLASMLNRPSIQKALSKASDLAQESGRGFAVGDTISVRDAQNMKMVLDDLIKDPKTFGLGASEVQAIQGTRGKFMEWLASKSPEWNAARAGYSQASKPINEMEVGQELLQALKNTKDADLPVRASTFQAAIENAPQTIKSGTGRQVADSLEEVLAPQNMEAVNAVSEAIARQSRLAEAAGRGTRSAMEILQPANPQIPNALSTPVTILNALIRRASGTGGKLAEKEVADLLINNPEKVAEILKTLPPGQAKQLLDEFAKLRPAAYLAAPQVYSTGESQ